MVDLFSDPPATLAELVFRLQLMERERVKGNGFAEDLLRLAAFKGPGVDRIQTLCLQRAGEFTAAAVERLAAESCSPGQVLADVLALDTATGAAQLTAILAAPGEPQAVPGVESEQEPTGPAVPEPKPEAIQAYWLQQGGYSQTRIAEMLKTTQGNVSKLLVKVAVWKDAGHKIPEIRKAEPLDSKPEAMDPAKIELGPRPDHRARQQAAKLAEIQGHGWDKE